MCGITAATGVNAKSNVDAVMECLHHRGPDSYGSSISGACALGMTRLAIMDPTRRADQPMSANGHHVVFNGEIYNFQVLRQDLIAEGVSFETSGDTEVVLHALVRWGRDAFQRFEGMFAIAWWSEQTRSLCIARDRYGVKPLYWVVDDGDVVVSSEFSPLWEMQSRSFSKSAIAEFLHFGSVISRSSSDGIAELPPGCVMRWQAGQVEQWQFANCFDGKPDVPAKAFHDAVIRQSYADRPLAVFLSGGVDSAMILAGLCEAGMKPLAITLATATNTEDVERARSVAGHFGVEQHVESIETDDAVAACAEFLDAVDQPTIDGFNTFLVCRAAKRLGIPVALSGLGGDEVLGGYSFYRLHGRVRSAANAYQKLPRVARRVVVKSIARGTGRPLERIEPMLSSSSIVDVYRAFRTLYSDEEVLALTGRKVEFGLPVFNVDSHLSQRHQLAMLDFQTYLRPTLLRDSDVFSMWHGVELRVPFLDSTFVSSVLQSQDPINKLDLVAKWGDAFLVEHSRLPKLTFGMPWRQWIGPVIERNHSLFEGDAWGEFVNTEVANSHLARCQQAPMRAWALVVLASVLQRAHRAVR